MKLIYVLLELVFNALYLIGPGGYGKTSAIREGIRQLQENNPDITIHIVAMTSVAAEVMGEVCGIRTRTFHSWWNIGSHSLRLHDERYMKSILDRLKPINPLKTDVLFIDEASMLTSQTLDVIDRVLRWYRKNPNVRFGGMKIVLIGDPLQLQPVPTQAGPGLLRDEHIESTSSLAYVDDRAGTEYVVLREPHRCRDPSFQRMLRGVVSPDMTVRREAMVEFDKHYRPGYETIPAIVRYAKANDAMIVSHRTEIVAMCNTEVRNLLRSQGKSEHQFEPPFRGFTDDQVVSIPNEEGIDIQDHLLREEYAITIERKRFFVDRSLYEGQLVQIRANHETENGVAATIGDVCLFAGCDNKRNAILIRKSDGKELIVGIHEAQSEYWHELKWKGYPFICADASTVHLVQGCTVPGQLIFYSNIVGDIYGGIPFYLNVAASRVTNPSNFVITHQLGKYALDSRVVDETLKNVWSLKFMKEYPV